MKQLKYLALATLVAFAACDEGTDVVVTPPVTGDIVGTVTIEGAAVSNVTVSLSTGETVTPVNGAYSFTGVGAGAYVVEITQFDPNATFSTTSKAVTITANAQVATVNFAGSWVRTSAVLGSVAAGGVGLAGVNVSLTGVETKSTVTSVDGTYSFSGLRAGTYSVAISGFAANLYAFANATQTVDPGTGEVVVADFVGLRLATSAISGTLFIDGNSNEQMDLGEPPIMKAGITVALERAIGDTIYTTTDANGMYTFPDLEEGTYKVIVDGTQSAVPGAFTQSGDIRYLAVATSGAPTTVNFPFVVTTQYVNVYGMLGVDAVNVGVAPIKDWSITLYPTELDAAAGTFPITTLSNKTAVKTDANGKSVFSFLRSKDYSPNKQVVDGIVFAKVAAPGAGYTVNGETTIEIPWLPMDSLVMAPDTFDATYDNLVVKVHAQEIDSDTLAAWSVQFRSGKDTTQALSVTQTNANGDAYFTIAGPPVLPNAYPDTVYVRLSPAAVQAGDNGHGWSATPTPNQGTAFGSYLRVIWDGTAAKADTVNAGMLRVKYTDSDVIVQVHHEFDDTMGYTAGDAPALGSAGAAVQLYKVTGSTKTSMTGVGLNPGTATTVGGGAVTFTNVPVANNYELRARALSNNYVMLNDTAFAITFDGSDQTYTDNRLGGSGALKSSFMVKTDNNTLAGKVASRFGAAPVRGLIVTVMPTAMNIQGSATKADTTDVAGNYSIAGLREGPYTITVAAGDSAYSFLRTLTTTASPAWSITSGSKNNTSPTAGDRDLQGYANSKVTNFEAYRTDTKFSGMIVNDRDTDLTTIDPGEALAGAVINLYMDDDFSATAGTDTLIGTATTDANGAYAFSGLREGRYVAIWASGTPSASVAVLRSVTAANVATTSVTGTPLKSANVGNTAANLPAWNYNTSAVLNGNDANFTFLYANTEVRGTIKKLSDGTTPVAGVTVTAKRCHTATTAVLTRFSGPINASGADFCSGYFSGAMSTTTDATGTFSFMNLAEGIYEVIVLPGSLAPYTTINRSPVLYWTLGSGDIETAAYLIS